MHMLPLPLQGVPPPWKEDLSSRLLSAIGRCPPSHLSLTDWHSCQTARQGEAPRQMQDVCLFIYAATHQADGTNGLLSCVNQLTGTEQYGLSDWTHSQSSAVSVLVRIIASPAFRSTMSRKSLEQKLTDKSAEVED
ncbi:hypothetical protein BaRGS_00003632 [Batillaria attramentaria]|uniref:Uncharacterized protein n=1 Tax=Batillaria attramentaria TaxID=370345 RepID=A0ABD0M1F7_9CAEN